MSFKFNKKEKLKSKKTVERLFREGKTITQYPLKMFYLQMENGQESRFKTGVAVSKKNFKSAVHRNRIKRLLRESYRLNKHLIFNNIEGNFAFLILYLGKDMPRYKEIEDALQRVFRKLVNEKR